jgi:hypothetical protein
MPMLFNKTNPSTQTTQAMPMTANQNAINYAMKINPYARPRRSASYSSLFISINISSI